MTYSLTPQLARAAYGAMERAGRLNRPVGFPRGVYGLAEVAAVRKAGGKPSSVHIDLVPKASAYRHAFCGTTSAEIEIEHGVSLNDIDLRPLVGLDVHLHAPLPEDRLACARHKRLATLIWALPTNLLVVPMHGPNDTLRLHIRRGNTLETHDL